MKKNTPLLLAFVSISMLAIASILNSCVLFRHTQAINKLAGYTWSGNVDSYLNRTMIIKLNDDVGTYDGIADPELAGHPLR